MNLGFGIAGIISPVVIGFVIDATGSRTLPFILSAALLVAGAALSVAGPPGTARGRLPVNVPGSRTGTGGVQLTRHVLDVIRWRADNDPSAPAILAPGRQTLRNSDLLREILFFRSDVAGFGIEKQDVVALSMSNGPENTLAYLATMASAICAPLNPALTASEFNYYLGELGARAILLPEGPSAASDAAERLGVPVIRLVPDRDGPAGSFVLNKGTAADVSEEQEARPEDIALLLYTSGTTSRAKLVPPSHRNLRASARNVAAPLSLSPADRCLSVMPLFHSHGLLGSTWAAIASGGCLICPADFRQPTSSIGSETWSQHGTQRFRQCTRQFWHVRAPSASIASIQACGLRDLLRLPCLPP